MILLISCFVTHDRPVNTCNRLDLFMHTLKSYSRIDWDDIYLLIKLDEEFKPREQELKEFIKKIFSKNKVVYIPERYEYQWQWKKLIKKITYKDNIVWFTQNDDHPFIDINLNILNEGIDLLLKDTGKYRSIFFSHWPEILRLSGKFSNPAIVGNYVKFQATMFDSVQIFNTEYLKYIFLHLDWGGKQIKRIDSLYLFAEFKPALDAICGVKNSSYSPILTVYIPLRELCRKYIGYTHVSMEWVRPLELSNDLSFKIKRPPFDDLNIINTMTANHNSPWTFNNSFKIPQHWINKSLSLYKQKTDDNHIYKNSNFKILEKIKLFIKKNL
jgi:hypothetical protein